MNSFLVFKETVKELEKELDSIENAYDNSTVSKIEMRSVRILQLLEAQIGSIGSELYSTLKFRRAGIAQGKYKLAPTPIEEAVEKAVEKSTPKRTKRTKAKKSE